MIWAPIENVKVIGILPEYRDLLKNGQSEPAAAKTCAQDLINNDKLNLFTPRINNVKYPIETLAKHITRMNGVAAGDIAPEFADEPNWARCFPNI